MVGIADDNLYAFARESRGTACEAKLVLPAKEVFVVTEETVVLVRDRVRRV